MNSDLGGNRFGHTVDGRPGWKEPGADTVIPFRNEKSFFDLFEKISSKRDYYDAVISPSGGTAYRDINNTGIYSGKVIKAIRTPYNVLQFYALVPCYAKIYPNAAIIEYQENDLIYTVSSGNINEFYTVEAVAKL